MVRPESIHVGDPKDAPEASLRGLREWLQHLGETEGQKTLILLSEGLVTDSPSDLEDVVRTAMRGRVAVNVLLMDVPRSDATQGPLPPTFTEDRELEIRGLNDLASLSRGSIFQVVGTADRAFERLYRKYVSDVYRYALALVRSEADAEDVTQTTFLNAFRGLSRGVVPASESAWLFKIAENVCLSRHRAAFREPDICPTPVPR